MGLTTTIAGIGHPDLGFFSFVWRRRTNRGYLTSAIALTTVLWTLFKILYPYPNVIFDSYNYVRAAALNWNFNAWPIGYSKFLQLFAFFSHSANLLVCLQYVFLESACLVFFFSWLFLFRPGRLITLGLFVLLFANPLLLYCCNYIISDPLFISLSLLWINQLLWVICRPRLYMVFTHALLLGIAFTVRYNALYYPFIAMLAFMLSRRPLWYKAAGIIIPFVLVAAFTEYTRTQVKAFTGEKQFSAFGSWKLANDALYIYARVLPGQPEGMPEKFRELDSMVRQYFLHTQGPVDILYNDFTSGSFFMYALNTPLVTYMEKHYGGGWPFLNTKKYWIVAPLYQSYALFLIRKYPGAFTRYFLLPNFLRYYAPPGEIFGSRVPFQLNESYGGPYLRKMLNITTIETKDSSIDLSVKILTVYQPIIAIGHFGFLFGLISFLFLRGYRRIGNPYNYCLLLIAVLWCCDLAFSVLSAGIVLRYQIFVMVPEIAFGLYFIEFVYRVFDKRIPLSISSKSVPFQ